MTASDSLVRVSIAPLPSWLDVARLVGSDHFEREALTGGALRVSLELPATRAAGLVARLRGLGIDGEPLEVQTAPPLGRALVRAGRLQDARDRRETSPGFTLPGARATGEGRYSLTAEALAQQIGALASGRTVVEACAGSGGNTLGFAAAGARVTALEIDPGRLAEARHNAALYGFSPRVQFELADARERVPQLRADVLFIDPPWGEPYDKRSTERTSFPLLDALLALDLSAYSEVWLKVPASFRVASVSGARASAWFGVAPGDRHRIKFLLLQLPGAARGGVAGGGPLRA